MATTRRLAMGSLLAGTLLASQDPGPPDNDRKRPFPSGTDEDRLPNGKSQKNEIARMNFEQSMRDVDAMVEAAESLRDELKKSKGFTVSVSSLRKTEEIEKLARKIRGRLKA